MAASEEAPSDREALFASYLRRLAAGRRDRADLWAWQAVDDAIHRGPPEAAWALVAELLRRTPDDSLGALAAGHLEDVVSLYGTELIDHIEVAARQDPRFRLALGKVWLSWGTLPEAIVERVVRASGGAIRPLGERRGGRQ